MEYQSYGSGLIDINTVVQNAVPGSMDARSSHVVRVLTSG
jgi:hypothetical protein